MLYTRSSLHIIFYCFWLILEYFFELLRSPIVDDICTSRTQRVVGDNSHNAYHQRLNLIQWDCWMKRPEATLHDRVHETGSTDVLRTQVDGGFLFLQL